MRSAETTTPRWRGASAKHHRADVGLHRQYTACGACGQPTRRPICPTCTAWIKVHRAHLDMARALEVVNG